MLTLSRSDLEAAKALEASGVALVTIMSSTGRYLYVSRPHFKVFGYRESEMIGHYLAEFTTPKDLAIMHLAIQDCVLVGGESVEVGLDVIAKDGTIMHIRGSGRRLTDPESGDCLLLTRAVVVPG